MSKRHVIAILLFGITSVLGGSLYRYICEPRFSPEEISPETLKLIDFPKLSPTVANFINLAQQNKVVGEPISAFPNRWKEALPLHELTQSERFHWRKFLLPETAELKAENGEKVAKKEGILYWPVLEVRIDSEEARIVRVHLFTQGF